MLQPFYYFKLSNIKGEETNDGDISIYFSYKNAKGNLTHQKVDINLGGLYVKGEVKQDDQEVLSFFERLAISKILMVVIDMKNGKILWSTIISYLKNDKIECDNWLKKRNIGSY